MPITRTRVIPSRLTRTRVIPVGLAGTDFELFNQSYYNRVMSIQPQYMIGAWPLDDALGRRAGTNRILTTYPSLSMLYNGDFETLGGGGADIWAVWTETIGDGALADEGIDVHGGIHAAKITSGVTRNTWITQTYTGNYNRMHVLPGWSVTLSFWTHGDGVNAGRYGISNATAGGFIKALTSTGITGIVYTQFSYTAIIPAGCYEINIYLAGPDVNGGIAYFDDVILTSSNLNSHAWMIAGGITASFGRTGIGDGLTASLHNGANSALEIGNPAYNAAFNGDKGSSIAWGRVDSLARWADLTTHRYLWHPKSRTFLTTYMVSGKWMTAANTLFWRRRINAATFERTYTFSSTGPSGWFCMGFNWDVTSVPKRLTGWVYAPGHTVFTKVFDEEPAAGIGDQVWDKAIYPVDDANSLIMAGGENAQLWVGNGAHCYQWAGITLSEIEMRKVMVL